MPLILALLSSVLWGIADFAGGTASRRLPSMVVVLVSQAIGLLVALVAAAVVGAFGSPAGYVWWAVAAGLVGVVGLLAFYRALATGTMGVVSPIAALGVVVPVMVGFVTGQWPSAAVGVGIALAIIGVVAASGPERSAGRSLRPVLLAVVAAVCFGLTLLFIARGAEYSAVMTMVVMRVSSVILLGAVLLAARATHGAGPSPSGAAVASRSGSRGSASVDDAAALPRPAGAAGAWATVAVAGVFDVGANLTFAVASTGGALAVVAILGSLYPAVTVLLARIIHAERLTRLQQVGVIVALAGVALIAGRS